MRNIWAFQWEHRGHCKHPGRAVLEVCWKLKGFLIGKLKLCEDQSLLMKQIDFGSIFPLGKVKWNYLLGIVSRVSFMPVIQCLTEFSFLRNIASRLWPEITLQTGMGRLPGTGFSTVGLGNCKKQPGFAAEQAEIIMSSTANSPHCWKGLHNWFSLSTTVFPHSDAWN